MILQYIKPGFYTFDFHSGHPDNMNTLARRRCITRYYLEILRK